MSIPVELADLRAKTTEYTWAYLLTVRPDATPHLVSLAPQWSLDDAPRILLSVSAGTARNAVAGNMVTLCFPPLDHDGYSLIVDGVAESTETAETAETAESAESAESAGSAETAGVSRSVAGSATVPDGKQLISFVPRGAVLHRSAAPGFANSATGCANDCLPIAATEEQPTHEHEH